MSSRIADPVVRQQLPTHLDLPFKDDKPVDNFMQPLQASLLTGSLIPVLNKLHPERDYAIGQDSGIYWKITSPPLKGARAPDWFLVEGVPPLLDGEIRRSYVLWQELIAPSIILEFASGNGMEERDRTPQEGKFWVYEQAVCAPVYGIFSIQDASLEVFGLNLGHYSPLKPNAFDRYAFAALGVELGVWQGRYRNTDGTWLRWWDEKGELLLTPEESSELERQRADLEQRRADEEQRRAEKERQRAELLAEKLKSLGIDPNSIP